MRVMHKNADVVWVLGAGCSNQSWPVPARQARGSEHSRRGRRSAAGREAASAAAARRRSSAAGTRAWLASRRSPGSRRWRSSKYLMVTALHCCYGQTSLCSGLGHVML